MPYLSYRNFLNIFKYNQKLQKKLEISKNDYIKYNQIEIDIIPIEFNKNIDKQNIINFFSIEKAYYHIFINDKEIKRRNYLKKDDYSKKIKIVIEPQIKSLKRLFYNCKYIKEINFVNFNRIDISDMSYMFYYCENVVNINLTKFKTNNVINMQSMFSGCKKLQQLNVSNFDTSKVETMKKMFEGCDSLNELDLSKFNTSKVTNMSKMFRNCFNLKKLIISNFDTAKVDEMDEMFFQCKMLKSLNVSSFDTRHVFNMEYMFSICISLIDLDITNFYFDRNAFIDNIFEGCSNELKDKIKKQNKKLPKNAFGYF